MKKRILAILLCLCMTVTWLPGTAWAASGTAEGLGNFKKVRSYEGFSDVKESAWYYNDVRSAYELGLISGSDGKFDPTGNLTLAQAITMACNVSKTYFSNPFTPGGDPWYQNAVDYAKKMSLIPADGYKNYNEPAKRKDIAMMFANSILSKELPRINRVAWIPDVDWSTTNRDYIYALYNAGVLSGGASGEFRPNDNISRAEAAALMNRLVDTSKRVKFTLAGNAPGTLIEAQDGSIRVTCAPDRGWILKRDYESGKNAQVFLRQEDGSAQIDFQVAYKSTTSKTIKEWSEDAVKSVEDQGSTIDKELHSGWLRGYHEYSFTYHYTASDGTKINGAFYCIENSKCLVYMWVLYKENCTEQVYNELFDIRDSLDMPL